MTKTRVFYFLSAFPVCWFALYFPSLFFQNFNFPWLVAQTAFLHVSLIIIDKMRFAGCLMENNEREMELSPARLSLGDS